MHIIPLKFIFWFKQYKLFQKKDWIKFTLKGRILVPQKLANNNLSSVVSLLLLRWCDVEDLAMADADSLHDMSSDLDVDQSAVDADVEDDEVSGQRYLSTPSLVPEILSVKTFVSSPSLFGYLFRRVGPVYTVSLYISCSKIAMKWGTNLKLLVFIKSDPDFTTHLPFMSIEVKCSMQSFFCQMVIVMLSNKKYFKQVKILYRFLIKKCNRIKMSKEKWFPKYEIEREYIYKYNFILFFLSTRYILKDLWILPF